MGNVVMVIYIDMDIHNSGEKENKTAGIDDNKN